MCVSRPVSLIILLMDTQLSIASWFQNTKFECKTAIQQSIHASIEVANPVPNSFINAINQPVLIKKFSKEELDAFLDWSFHEGLGIGAERPPVFYEKEIDMDYARKAGAAYDLALERYFFEFASKEPNSDRFILRTYDDLIDSGIFELDTVAKNWVTFKTRVPLQGNNLAALKLDFKNDDAPGLLCTGVKSGSTMYYSNPGQVRTSAFTFQFAGGYTTNTRIESPFHTNLRALLTFPAEETDYPRPSSRKPGLTRTFGSDRHNLLRRKPRVFWIAPELSKAVHDDEKISEWARGRLEAKP